MTVGDVLSTPQKLSRTQPHACSRPRPSGGESWPRGCATPPACGTAEAAATASSDEEEELHLELARARTRTDDSIPFWPLYTYAALSPGKTINSQPKPQPRTPETLTKPQNPQPETAIQVRKTRKPPTPKTLNPTKKPKTRNLKPLRPLNASTPYTLNVNPRSLQKVAEATTREMEELVGRIASKRRNSGPGLRV